MEMSNHSVHLVFSLHVLFHIFVGCIWVPQFLSHASAIAVEQGTDLRA